MHVIISLVHIFVSFDNFIGIDLIFYCRSLIKIPYGTMRGDDSLRPPLYVTNHDISLLIITF